MSVQGKEHLRCDMRLIVAIANYVSLVRTPVAVRTPAAVRTPVERRRVRTPVDDDVCERLLTTNLLIGN